MSTLRRSCLYRQSSTSANSPSYSGLVMLLHTIRADPGRRPVESVSCCGLVTGVPRRLPSDVDIGEVDITD